VSRSLFPGTLQGICRTPVSPIVFEFSQLCPFFRRWGFFFGLVHSPQFCSYCFCTGRTPWLCLEPCNPLSEQDFFSVVVPFFSLYKVACSLGPSDELPQRPAPAPSPLGLLTDGVLLPVVFCSWRVLFIYGPMEPFPVFLVPFLL